MFKCHVPKSRSQANNTIIVQNYRHESEKLCAVGPKSWSIEYPATAVVAGNLMPLRIVKVLQISLRIVKVLQISFLELYGGWCETSSIHNIVRFSFSGPYYINLDCPRPYAQNPKSQTLNPPSTQANSSTRYPYITALKAALLKVNV